MDKPPRSDNELDRLLGHGNLSGPEADRLWERIAPAVVAREQPAWRMWLARPWVWAGGSALALGLAALVLFPRDVAPPGFTARGEDAVSHLYSSCGGGQAPPCRVGTPVFLRWVQSSDPGFLYVRLDTPTGGLWVVRGQAMAPGTTALSVQLTPDESDIPNGIGLRFWVFPEEQGAAAVTALEAPEATPLGTLRVAVEAAP